MNLFLSSDADEYIILLINSISVSEFEKFISVNNNIINVDTKFQNCFKNHSLTI